MLAIVAPEPVDWLAPLCDELASSGQAIRVFAPWAVRGRAPGFFPAAIARFWERRVLAQAAYAQPAWLVGDALLRAWSGTNVERVMRARVWRRRAADRLAARWLPDDAVLVIAPALGARQTLARAQSRGQRTALVEDLPSLRELHADLDLAAARWPDCRFLRRFRAPADWVAEQEAERVLADVLLVRSAFAERLRRGHHPRVVGLRPRAEVGVRVAIQSPPRTVLLAGTAAARHGSNEILAALEKRSDVTLLVHPGEGMEPTDLLQRSKIRAATLAERSTLAGVDCVVAPALCESHLPQLARAAALGVPIVATDRAAGFVDATLVPVGDIAALASALDAPSVAPTIPTDSSSLWDKLNAPIAPPRRTHLPIV